MKPQLELSGIGIHSGQHCTLKLRRLSPGSGCVFKTLNGRLKAGVDVIDPASIRSTALKQNGNRVRTIEHLMAALWWYGLLDVEIEISGEEIPILDGSAEQFVAALSAAGIEPQPRFFEVNDTLEIEMNGASARISPTDADEKPIYKVTVAFKELSSKASVCAFSPLTENFVKCVSKARTFAFEREILQLRANGLAVGGSLDNALVIGDKGPLNKDGLRYPNEPARHKLLDAIGDLALLGGLPRAHVTLYRPGHQLLHQVGRVLAAKGYPAFSGFYPH